MSDAPSPPSIHLEITIYKTPYERYLTLGSGEYINTAVEHGFLWPGMHAQFRHAYMYPRYLTLPFFYFIHSFLCPVSCVPLIRVFLFATRRRHHALPFVDILRVTLTSCHSSTLPYLKVPLRCLTLRYPTLPDLTNPSASSALGIMPSLLAHATSPL